MPKITHFIISFRNIIINLQHEWGIRGIQIGSWWESQKEKCPLGKPTCRWVDNIKMDLKVIGWDGMEWIDLNQNKD
jgi:hypothetical protein